MTSPPAPDQDKRPRAAPPASSRVPRGFKPEPFDYHEEIEIEIGSLGNLGQGVGRTADGWVVFVPFALPGEPVRARVYRNHKNYSDADLVEVLDASPHRVGPRCPLFGTCGGCQYQNLDYPEQLAWKRRQVAELLAHLAGIGPGSLEVKPVVPSPDVYGYRSKITPHFDKPKDGRALAIGFLRSGSRHAVIDVPQCPIASPAINTALPALRAETLAGARKRKRGATLLLRESADGTVLTDPREVTNAEVGGVRLSFLAGDFFQNNPSALPAFTGYVAGAASATGNRFLLDAYCGSGLFALTAADRFERVAGIEISESSADWARQNAAQNGIDNATFHAGSAERLFEASPFPAADTSVVIDPPRKGCGPEFIDQLVAFGPARVVYVSCNPATQMRDLKWLIAHGYQPREVQPFDLFPHTKHLECVVTLDRAE